MENKLRHDLNTSGMVLLILLLSQNMLQMPFLMIRRSFFFLGGFGFSAFTSQLVQTAVYAGAMLLTIFFGAWITRCDRQFLFPIVPTRRDYLCPAVGAGLGVGMIGNIIATLLTALLAMGGINSNENTPSFNGGLIATLLTLFSVAVLPAIFEELLFRGVLLQPLRKYGDSVAVVLSALMFAICHPTLPQFINAFLVGLCLAVFAVRSGSLVAPMLIHFTYNATACVITMLSVYIPHAPVTFISWAIIIALAVLGIFSAILLRRRFGSVFRLSTVAYIPTRPYAAVTAVFCSLPLLLAFFLNIMTILNSLYR